MKESGFNYFHNHLGFDSGNWRVFYTFEDGAGSKISSVSGGQTLFSGELNSVGEFWNIAGSGFVSGNFISVKNASGLSSDYWTKIFVYEKLKGNDCSLFDSRIGSSGYKIGLNDANKLYLETETGKNLSVASYNTIGGKNAVAVTYSPNLLSFNYYNATTQTFESENFNQPFALKRSDRWKLFEGFTGYCDYYLYFSDLIAESFLTQLMSGLFYRFTGKSYQTETICQNLITGYQNVSVMITGITGYVSTPSGSEGRDYYTGEFPTTNSIQYLTGIISQSIVQSGVTGEVCYIVTGEETDGLEYLSGYAKTFGMDKLISLFPIDSPDIIKLGLNTIPNLNIFNKRGSFSDNAFYFDDIYFTGKFNGFLNGLAFHISGLDMRTGYALITNSDVDDILIFDAISGQKNLVLVGASGILPYSGQEIFLNGINLISGHDFRSVGLYILLTGNNTGISGDLFEYPSTLSFITGTTGLYSGEKFARLGSVLYINGIRQNLSVDYFEGSVIDKLNKNTYNYFGNQSIYNNNGSYWE